MARQHRRSGGDRAGEVSDNLRVKEVRVGEGDAARRFIVCHNPDEQLRDRERRERAAGRRRGSRRRPGAAAWLKH